MWQQRQRLGWCSHKSRGAWSSQKLEEAGGAPLEPQEGAWPCHTSIADFWPQNCRRINSVVFNHVGDSSGGSVLT